MQEDAGHWICQCRRCNGVFNSAEAVQYVWEWAFGSCGVDVVVGVNAKADGFVCIALTYWHDEPDEPCPVGDGDEYIVTCRPGQGTLPTEGDVARWVSWESSPQKPADWLLVDGHEFRSVRDTVAALRSRAAIPAPATIAGDWHGANDDASWREETRADWADIKARNQAFHRL